MFQTESNRGFSAVLGPKNSYDKYMLYKDPNKLIKDMCLFYVMAINTHLEMCNQLMIFKALVHKAVFAINAFSLFLVW